MQKLRLRWAGNASKITVSNGAEIRNQGSLTTKSVLTLLILTFKVKSMAPGEDGGAHEEMWV